MSVRRAALEALTDITENGAYANLRLKSALFGREERDASFISALVYTTLDHLLYIDHILGHFAKGRMNANIRGVLRLGVCQLMFMNVPASAACNESVKLAKEIGKGALSGYVNGVMRSIARAKDAGELPKLPKDPVDRLCVECSYPRYIVEEYVCRYGADFTRDMLSYKEHGMTVRAQYPFTEGALIEWLEENGAEYGRGTLVRDAFKLKKGFDVASSELFQNGSITVQSESAMLVCRALKLRGNERVLDACAAPGGKSAYIASITGNGCKLTAWDVHEHRVELMKNTFMRLNVTCAAAECQDASVLHGECRDMFDAVLVDAPCSGLGVTGKPDARYAKNDGVIDGLAILQHEILSNCAAYVRPGGVLVYSTCTVSEWENEAQIERFLSEHSDFALSAFCDILPEGAGERTDGMLQLFPHIHNTEGFFIARLERKAK